MADGAPLIHEDWETDEADGALVRELNTLGYSTIVKGDADAALADADVVVKSRYLVDASQGVPIEPRAVIAEWHGNRVTVWSSTQVPFEARKGIAHALQISESEVRVIVPLLGGGFGSKIKAGSLSDILGQIADKKTPFYSAEGRFYINPYPKDDVPKAKAIAAYGPVIPGYEQGVVALYQRCVHLGCRVPWCLTSQWFECPCHGSQYNRVGEKKGGPAPRGLDRFVVSVDGGNVIVDTKQVIQGPPIGTNTTGQEAEGPHCVGGRAE